MGCWAGVGMIIRRALDGVALGGVALGRVALGGVALGRMSLGGVGLGGVALGCVLLSGVLPGGVAVGGFGGLAGAAEYYVDYEGGSNAADGRSPGTALKHCPGDASATGVAAATVLAAGDTVIFKGGVRYRSTVLCKWSGAAGSPIVYDGNTAGTFGIGRGIIDGSRRLTGWVQCASADEAGDNEHWQNIYRVRVPAAELNVFAASLYDGSRLLWAAQDPNPPDPFYYDALDSFRSINSSAVTRTTLTDASYFTPAQSNYWDGAVLLIWGNPNVVRARAVTAFDGDSGTITFADTGSNSLYEDGRTVYYAMMNHLALLDRPGEFVIGGQVDGDGMRTVWLWPLDGEEPLEEREITSGIRRVGLDLNGKSNITVRGLQIEKHTAGLAEYGSGMAIRTTTGGSNIVIRDNLLTRNRSLEKQGVIRMYGGCSNVLIEDNLIEENPVNRGVILTFDDGIFRNNQLRRNGGTAVDFYGCRRSQMVGNRVTEHTGVHANGLTLYLNCEDVLVAYNTVYDGACALTLQDGRNITVAYNILHTDHNTYTATDWGRCDGLFYYNNVMMNKYSKALSKGSTTSNVTVRNNIVDGNLAGFGPQVSHNIYTSLGWTQSAKYGWTLGEGEQVVTDKGLVFVDAEGRDFRLAVGSPAIDAGTAIAGLNRDHSGRAVPQGAGVDVGALEFVVLMEVSGWKVPAMHGGNEVAVPVGAGYVESRLGGPLRVSVQFSGHVDPATVGSGLITISGPRSGDVSSRIGSVGLIDERTILITMAEALPDAERLTFTIGEGLRGVGGVTLSGGGALQIGVLAGDVDGSGVVDAADVMAVRGQVGRPVSAATARYDVDGSGSISGSDMQRIRSLVGNRLP